MLVTPPPLFIAFEVSDFGPHGYPVEIGWSDPNGDAAGYLIRPAVNWFSRPWSEDAQALHGIERPTITGFGMAPAVAVHLLGRAAAGRTLYSDRVNDSERWLALLFDAARVKRAPDLKILCASSLFRDLSQHHNLPLEPVEALARAGCPAIHRAEYDARHLASIYRIFQYEIDGVA